VAHGTGARCKEKHKTLGTHAVNRLLIPFLNALLLSTVYCICVLLFTTISLPQKRRVLLQILQPVQTVNVRLCAGVKMSGSAPFPGLRARFPGAALSPLLGHPFAADRVDGKSHELGFCSRHFAIVLYVASIGPTPNPAPCCTNPIDLQLDDGRRDRHSAAYDVQIVELIPVRHSEGFLPPRGPRCPRRGFLSACRPAP